jgi:uncharacterized protein (DUF39 family)
MYLSAKVALELKQWLLAGKFTLTEPVAALPSDRAFFPQDRWGSQILLE